MITGFRSGVPYCRCPTKMWADCQRRIALESQSQAVHSLGNLIRSD
ncbi:hypothetical protein T08_11029 [Trichinella sp. T8]|nr:hypothetical protein T08_11029 [Trichinella sp. T8]